MKKRIKKRLTELYEMQSRLLDENRVWVRPENSLSRSDQIIVNKHIIRELEALLNKGVSRIGE